MVAEATHQILSPKISIAGKTRSPSAGLPCDVGQYCSLDDSHLTDDLSAFKLVLVPIVSI